MDLNEILNQIPSTNAPDPQADSSAAGPAEAQKQDIQKPVEKKYESERRKHQDRELGARGLKRDAETGQFTSEKQSTENRAKPQADPQNTPEQKQEQKTEKQELSEKERAFLRAMEEERRKRQELERRLAEIEATRGAEKPAPEEKKSFWDDPERALQAHQAQVRNMLIHERLVMSEGLARSRYPDFDEKMDVFEQLVKETPGLQTQMINSTNPAEFAYQAAKRHKDITEAGSLEALRKKIEEETRAKVESEIREKIKKDEEERRRKSAELPQSISDATGSNPTRPVWGGPTPLDNILKS